MLARRDGDEISLRLVPRPRADNARAGSIGVTHFSSFANREPIGPLTALAQGAQDTWGNIARTGAYIGGIFTGKESGDQIAGPLGIMSITGQVASSALDAADATPWQRMQMLVLSLLTLSAMISVAVGLANLLPIPILDGGHLLFYAIEGLRGGKPLPPVAQDWAYRAGLAVMASLFLFATWNDIARLFPGAQ